MKLKINGHPIVTIPFSFSKVLFQYRLTILKDIKIANMCGKVSVPGTVCLNE